MTSVGNYDDGTTPNENADTSDMFEMSQQRSSRPNSGDSRRSEHSGNGGEEVRRRGHHVSKINVDYHKTESDAPGMMAREPTQDELYGGDLKTNKPTPVIHSEASQPLPPIQQMREPIRQERVERTEKKNDKFGHMGEIQEREAGGGIGCCGYILLIFSVILVILFLPFSLCLTFKVVQEYERAVIFRLGRIMSGGAKGPGMFFILPCIDEFKKVDLRTVSYDIPPQEILTRDSVTVAVDAVIYSRVFDPTMSVVNVENAFSSTRLLAATTLRNILGTKNMGELLTERDSIAADMQQMLDDATDPWGIKVERVEIKDVRLPLQLQRAMAAEAEASREAKAKVIAAEGEQKASRALKEAADIIAQSPSALQLRYLQTLNTIAAEKNSTIVFPLPIDLISSMAKK